MGDKGKLSSIWVSFISSILILILVLSLVFVSAYILNKFEFGIKNDTVVLTFVGILATFIVIGNFTQVIQIKSEFEKRVEVLEFMIKETKNIEENLKKDFFLYFDYLIELKIKIDTTKNVDLMNENKYWHSVEYHFLNIEYSLFYNNILKINEHILIIYQLIDMIKKGGYSNKPISDSNYFTEEKKQKWIELIKKVNHLYANEILNYLINKEI